MDHVYRSLDRYHLHYYLYLDNVSQVGFHRARNVPRSTEEGKHLHTIASDSLTDAAPDGVRTGLLSRNTYHVTPGLTTCSCIVDSSTVDHSPQSSKLAPPTQKVCVCCISKGDTIL